MTEGISKDTLLSINPWDYDNQQDLLNEILGLCAELDPWLPIGENTPKDRAILLLLDRGIAVTGYFSAYHWVTDIFDEFDCSNAVTPTHYKLLPKDPK